MKDASFIGRSKLAKLPSPGTGEGQGVGANPALRIVTLLRRVYPLVLLAMVVLLAQPLRTTTSRAAIIACFIGVWAGAPILAWKRAPLRVALLILPLLPLAVFLLPGRPIDTLALQRAYVASLRHYEGTPYVWGGETRTGIDCSGLVRAGLFDAETREGLRTANPLLLRRALSLWWNDCSALALGEEYQERTKRLETVRELNAADYGDGIIQPGDIAVTDSGLHTLAYLGDRTWIEADPHVGKVHLCAIPDDQIYFSMEAKILRWRTLAP